jgi:hypothetical protein
MIRFKPLLKTFYLSVILLFTLIKWPKIKNNPLYRYDFQTFIFYVHHHKITNTVVHTFYALKLIKYFANSKFEAYNLKKGVVEMDQIMMKKLNKQALLFVVIHTVFIFNLVFEFL